MPFVCREAERASVCARTKTPYVNSCGVCAHGYTTMWQKRQRRFRAVFVSMSNMINAQ